MTNTNTNAGEVDPTSLSLIDLRQLRNQLQHEDDVVSYVRRVAQARFDLVLAERARRSSGDESADIPQELRGILSQHLVGGSPRPPRPVLDLEADPLSDELDAICADHGFSRLKTLDNSKLEALENQLQAFERRVSDNRRARYELLDSLSAELVRRYRDGEASVDGLFERQP